MSQLLRRISPLPAALLCASVLTSCSDVFRSPSVDRPPPFDGIRRFSITIEIDSLERTALVVLPDSYDHSRRIPMLFVYHGGGGSAAQMPNQTGFDGLADEFGFAVVYPNAAGFWVTPCADCDNWDRSPLEELVLAGELVDYLSRNYTLDRERTYATGYSAGGILINYLGCRQDAPFRGIAPVAATAGRDLSVACSASSAGHRIAPVLITNGLLDRSVPPEGEEGRLGIDEVAAFWREWNRCGETADVEENPEDADGVSPRIVRTEWSDCAGESKVQLQEVEQTGHTWLTEHNNASGIDYGRTIVSFFGLDL